MLDVSRFVDALLAQGADYFTGVPCSYLTPLIDEVIARRDTRYILASSEGDALAIASGLWLGGKHAVVLCQNSGLGNMVNPLSSLNEPFGIPALLLITWRGKPGMLDEPQHRLMGQITPDLLTLMGIEWALLPEEEDAALCLLHKASDYLRHEQRPFALLMSGESFQPRRANAAPQIEQTLPQRRDALATILAHGAADAVLIATTGKTGRELFTLADRPGHFYCVGSMGYASALAHGVALASERPVYLIDGDGAALMHLGNLTSIGASRPARLTHILLDNRVYDSTGAQPSAAASTDFVALALAAGYAAAHSCDSCAALAAALHQDGESGPRLLHMPIQRGSMAPLSRPSITPYTVARRMKQTLTAHRSPSPLVSRT